MNEACYELLYTVYLSGGDPGDQKTPPHFPEWGVTYKAVTPSFDTMLMSLFSLYVLVMNGDSCR